MKLIYDEPALNFAFNSNLRRYTEAHPLPVVFAAGGAGPAGGAGVADAAACVEQVVRIDIETLAAQHGL